MGEKMYRLYMLVLALVLIGCVSTSGREITAADISGFKKGETTVDEVIAKLGPPRSNTVTSDGVRTIIYVYLRASKGRPEIYIPAVGVEVEGVEQKTSSMHFIFGPDGRLRASSRPE